jgi:NAD(P)-dependent dehydrogenase (short-subunit alcohol dehydrogenase family)
MKRTRKRKRGVIMDLEGKVVIITGAGMGIGKAIAHQLAREGADLVLADILVDDAQEVADEVKSMGRRAIAVKADVTRSDEVKQMVRKALDEFGKIDILVNNAGGGARERMSQFHESTEDTWDFVIGRNLKGTMICSRAVIEHMIERRSGKIISMASSTAVHGLAGAVDYATAKAGVIGFTKSLAKEVAKYGIYVNCVSPGAVETSAVADKTPQQMEALKQSSGLGRIGKPEEIAYMIEFLASDKSNYISGQNMLVCGPR